MNHMDKPYYFRVLIGLDNFLNSVIGGSPDHTISGRVGYHALQGNSWALIAEEVINTIFWFDEDHCRSSIEWDEI